MALTNQQKKTISKLHRRMRAAEGDRDELPSLRLELQRAQENGKLNAQRAADLTTELAALRTIFVEVQGDLAQEAARYAILCELLNCKPGTVTPAELLVDLAQAVGLARQVAGLRTKLAATRTELARALLAAREAQQKGSPKQQRRLAEKGKELEGLRTRLGALAVKLGDPTIALIADAQS